MSEIFRDEANPDLMFQLADTELLVKCLSREVNMLKQVKKEMANRGLDRQGKFIGFKEARKLYKLND